MVDEVDVEEEPIVEPRALTLLDPDAPVVPADAEPMLLVELGVEVPPPKLLSVLPIPELPVDAEEPWPDVAAGFCVEVLLSIIESFDVLVVEAGFLVGSFAPVPSVLAMLLSLQLKTGAPSDAPRVSLTWLARCGSGE